MGQPWELCILALPTCQDLLEHYFKLSPRVASMVKHGDLCSRLIGLARNGVISKVSLNEALVQLAALQPQLVEKVGSLGLVV